MYFTQLTLCRPTRKKSKSCLPVARSIATPQEVRNPLFIDNDFFDPHDLVQLKYGVNPTLVSPAAK
jgi:hypothetical protein